MTRLLNPAPAFCPCATCEAEFDERLRQWDAEQAARLAAEKLHRRLRGALERQWDADERERDRRVLGYSPTLEHDRNHYVRSKEQFS